MGAQCSKASEQDQVSNEDDERQNASPSLRTWHSFQGTRNGIESAGAGNHQVANADLATQGGSFLSFATRSHELSPDKVVRSYGYEPERNKEEKKKLARVLSDKATSVRSRTATVAKKGASRVSEVLKGAGTMGFGALDIFGTSVANLGAKGGFIAGAVSKGNKIGILSFEVANTIVKGCNLKQSLAEEDMKVLVEEILPSEGVQRLVSTDENELMAIAGADKRNELKIYADEVVRFGNHCKDPRWHRYDRVFDRLVKEMEIPRVEHEEADNIMETLMTLAQNTADLYHELHALDRFRTDLKRKQQEEESAVAPARGGESIALLRSEVKSQEKHVEALKKRSLWSRNLEEVMEQLVDIANYLYQEIQEKFGPYVFLEKPEEEEKRNAGKLGPSGLALHYANIINQIDSLVLRPGSVPPNTRDNLYQGLPPAVKAGLRTRLQHYRNKNELSIDEIKSELFKLLNWIVAVASNTTKKHHGFGWVGEWANAGSPADRKALGCVEITLLQTLHHANQQVVEDYILELVVGLHHLVSRARNSKNINNGDPSPQRSPCNINVKAPIQQFLLSGRSVSPPPFGMLAAKFTEGLLYPTPAGVIRPELSQEDKDMLREISSGWTQRKIIPGLSRSQEFDNSKAASNKEFLKLNKSSSHSVSSKHELEAPLYKPRNRIKPLGHNIHRLDEKVTIGPGPLQS
ncbi:protein PSK SIMULATOR 1 [Physcomitrium patens]|uniref:DUF668 domain-containing protein n=1 Tax=Physcomitrium patens TaxID=3218 RepID=A0A2K1IAF7_PHYPA|nr:uncharacterized protein LOC112278457 [Physcomitrium patens]PNR26263.1 hypothetical protein PHYPA_030837 [Physcomitrium patens]|eukprot:XP_024367762.1 uncharacterized protein LOC112278457 [Physcomitrella patens]